MPMMPKKRLYLLLLLTAAGTLLLLRLSSIPRHSREISNFQIQETSPETTKSSASGSELDSKDSALVEVKHSHQKPESETEFVPRVIRPEKDPDEAYAYNYMIAKMGFNRFKKQWQKEKRLSNGEDLAVEEEDDEEYDDDDYNDYYDAEGLLKDRADKMDVESFAKLKFIEGFRNRNRAIQLSHNPETETEKQKETGVDAIGNSMLKQQESSDAISNCSSLLFRRDSLVRDCITLDIIGRIPLKIKTSDYSNNLLMDFEEKGIDRRNSFNNIFTNQLWGHSWDGETKQIDTSGRGATLSWAQETIAGLHTIVNQIKEELHISRVKILDIPCGDMKWMSHFLSARNDIDYTGIDIVHDLIESHKITYKNTDWKFSELDIVAEDMPGSYDLVVCRTLLQHLYSADVSKVLQKISDSGSKYLFVTTFSQERYNSDLEISTNNPGRFRRINLEIPPFSLKPPICLQRDGPVIDSIEDWRQFLGLWRLPLQQVANCERVKEFTLMGTGEKINSCIEWSPYIDLDS